MLLGHHRPVSKTLFTLLLVWYLQHLSPHQLNKNKKQTLSEFSWTALTTLSASAYALIHMKSYDPEKYTVKPVLSSHSKITSEIGFQYQLSPNAGQKYCRMLQGEHSAILSTFNKLPFFVKTFVLSIFKWPLKTGFTVPYLKGVKLP